MKAAVYARYGSPEVVRLAEIDRPHPGPDEILVRVAAAGVTSADWRLRAAAFPGLAMQIAGRLMFGLTGPRNRVLGSDFAGTVADVGASVEDFAMGDRVMGFAENGAHAEFLVVKAAGAVIRTPEALTDPEAAALPFGGLAALEFLDRFAALRKGERVLVVGASGGVGAYAVQIAVALGATVTAVASAGNGGFVRDLGAHEVVDYATTDVTRLPGTYDVIFDTIGVLRYRAVAPMLARGGRFVPLNFGPRDAFQIPRARRAGHQILLRINADTKAGLERLAAMIAAGEVRPIVGRTFPFDAIRDAHALVETRHRRGAVVLTFEPAAPEKAAA